MTQWGRPADACSSCSVLGAGARSGAWLAAGTRGGRFFGVLDLDQNQLGDVGVQALFEGLGPAAAPSLEHLFLSINLVGPAGAEALSAALRRGAMPKLRDLRLAHNPLGNQGVAALAMPLRQLPALDTLFLQDCNMGDEGLALLLAGHGRDDFKSVTSLYLDKNQLTNAGCARLIASLKAGALPKVEAVQAGADPFSVHASDEMLADLVRDLDAALEARLRRTQSAF